MLNNLLNEKQLQGELKVIQIDQTKYITIGEYQKRNNNFFDVLLYNNGKEIFLGRFNNDFGAINVKYSNDKILICTENIMNNNEGIVTKVLSLYDVVDDTFYSLSEKEALTTFDHDSNLEFLVNKENSIVRSDVEKKQKVKNKFL